MASSDQPLCAFCGTILTAAEQFCPQCGLNSLESETAVDPNQETLLRPTEPEPVPQPEPLKPEEATIETSMSPPPLARPRAPHATTIGRFQIIKILGQGTFGTVFRAFDPLLDREIALKVPRFIENTPATLERFFREAKAAARLHHPNVVAVFESGQISGRPFIANEFVDGTTLYQVLESEDEIDLRQGVEWVRQIADALYYAHTEDVVHRDIKPANIMINSAGRPQIMDFGLAKRAADHAAHITVEGTIVGTPAFMSPEQARGELKRVGPASDQYSVGVLLFALLCRKLPYEGDAWAILAQVGDRNGLTPSPRAIRPEIPVDLEACCLKAMEKEPEARYPNLNEMAEDLKRWLDGHTLRARPIGSLERFWRWCRRNRLTAALSGALAGLLLIATVVGFVLAWQFRELAEAKTQETKKATAARLGLERNLVDNYTENGLYAAQRRDDREAVLWFGQSAHLAENFEERREHNRMRMASWLNKAAVPVYAFRTGGEYTKSLQFHASGDYLLAETDPGLCVIHDLRTGATLPLPGDGPIFAAQWSPDGTRLALSRANELNVVNFPKLESVQTWPQTGDTSSRVSFSPAGDRLAVARSNHLRIYQFGPPAAAGTPLPLPDTVQSIQFSRSGDIVAAVTAQKSLHVLHVNPAGNLTPALEAPLQLPPKGHIQFGFLPDERLVSIESDGTLRCRDLKQEQECWTHQVGRAICLAVSPDGRKIAYETLESNGKHSARVLNAANGDLATHKVIHRNHILALAWHPEGKKLLACSDDHSASVTDMETGQPLAAVVPHNDFVLHGVWSPAGRVFATAHWSDDLVRVWRMPSDAAAPFDLPPDNEQGFAKFSADGRSMMLTGLDTRRTQREVQVYDTKTGNPQSARFRSEGVIHDAVHLPLQRLIVLGGSTEFHPADEPVAQTALPRTGVVRFVDQETGQEKISAIPTPTEPVALACDTNETTLVILCDDGQLLLVDPPTGKIRHQLPAANTDIPTADKGWVIRDRIRFCPDGRCFAVWGFGTKVRIHDTQTGAQLYELKHDKYYVHDVRFAPAGDQLVTCSSDKSARCWDVATGKLLATLDHAGWVFTARFNRDGTRLLTASQDHQARLWNWETKELVLSTLDQDAEVYGVEFAMNETVFITAAKDGTVRAWDTTTGKLLAPPLHFPQVIYQADLAPDQSILWISGRLKHLAGVHLDQWLRSPDDDLSPDDLLILAELVANQRVLETSVADRLTTDDWWVRWVQFQTNHPQHPLLQLH